MEAFQYIRGYICFKFYANGLEVSISCDDKLKTELPIKTARMRLCIFDGHINITSKCFGLDEVFSPSNSDVIKAIQFIEEVKTI